MDSSWRVVTPSFTGSPCLGVCSTDVRPFIFEHDVRHHEALLQWRRRALRNDSRILNRDNAAVEEDPASSV